MTHKLAFLRLLDSGTDRTHSLHFMIICARRAINISLHRSSSSGAWLVMLPVAFNCYELYCAIMQSSINKSLDEHRLRISRLTLNRMRLLMDFLWLNCDLSLRRVSWGFSILFLIFLLLPSIVVTFNFKFSDIITAFSLYTIQFFLWFRFEASASSAAKRFIVLRMDGKIVSGTDTAIVRVHFYTFFLLNWLYSKNFTEAHLATMSNRIVGGIGCAIIWSKSLFIKLSMARLNEYRHKQNFRFLAFQNFYWKLFLDRRSQCDSYERENHLKTAIVHQRNWQRASQPNE